MDKKFLEWGVNRPPRGGGSISPLGGGSIDPIQKKLLQKKSISNEIRVKTDEDMYTYQPVNEEGDEIKISKRGRNKIINPNPYIFEEELKRLQNAPQRQYRIVAGYWLEKGYRFTNREQHEASLGRDVVSAKKLIGYSGEQLSKAINYCRNKWPEDWGIETVVKQINNANL